MTLHAFTSFTYSYLDRARVLARSLKRHHPEWQLWACVTDRCPADLAHDWADEAFDQVIFADQLIGDDARPWLFGHDIVEACTAIKVAAAAHILDRPDCDKLFYFDPDIAVFNRFDPVIDLLDDHDIILTPHQTRPADPARRQAILDNEICSLSHGAYNLGFFALSNGDEARAFCRWWDARLRDWCRDDRNAGLFVDQKWCDLVPCFFDKVKILRDPGYNVASWNLEYRTLAFDPAGQLLVNGQPLRFFHFTKLGPVGDHMTRRYIGGNFEVLELWTWYRREVAASAFPGLSPGYWHYGHFDNGVPVPVGARRLYRDRRDLQGTFRDPFVISDGFFGWLDRETDLLGV